MHRSTDEHKDNGNKWAVVFLQFNTGYILFFNDGPYLISTFMTLRYECVVLTCVDFKDFAVR